MNFKIQAINKVLLNLYSSILTFVLMLSPSWVLSQESYNNCNTALELCSGENYAINNLGANVTFCPNCEDDFNFCFAPNNSVWMQFTTNDVGGSIQIALTNLVFENLVNQGTQLEAVLLSANIPCNSASYAMIGNCVFDATGDVTITDNNLLPNTTYYLVVSGAMNGGATLPAELSLDVQISGASVDRLTPSIQLLQSSTDTDICPNEILFFTVDTTNCTEAGLFEWYLNDELIATTTEPEFTTSSIGNGDQLSVKTTCYTLCPIEVQEYSPTYTQISFVVDAGEDQTILLGNPIQLNGTTSAPSFNWSPSFSLSDPSVLNPTAFPEVTTTYELSATQNGCTIADYVTITVESDLVIPNTFSPNDDGKNDTWVILGMEKYPNADVRIYNRWGQEVYQVTGYQKDKAWDGTGKTGKLNSGVYFYIIDLRDEANTEYKGNISLIR